MKSTRRCLQVSADVQQVQASFHSTSPTPWAVGVGLVCLCAVTACGATQEEGPAPRASMCDELDEATCEAVPECALVDFVETRLHHGRNWSWVEPRPTCVEGAAPSESIRTPVWKPTGLGRPYGFFLGGPVPVGWYPCPHEDDPLPEQCELAVGAAANLDIEGGEGGEGG